MWRREFRAWYKGVMHDLISNPLYQAVLANPADDLPRLVLADWLDEQGDSDRADFIRTQIELAKTPERDPESFWAEASAESCRRAWESPAPMGTLVPDVRGQVCQELHLKYTARRKSLVDRQMRLLWGDHKDGGSNWERWCWAAARDEGGMPVRGDGRGGTVVTPHGSGGLSGEPASCSVPLPDGGLLSQEWHRGFIGHIAVGSWLRIRSIVPAVFSCPVTRAVVKNAVPHENEDGSFSWWILCEGAGRDLAEVPTVIWRHLPMKASYGSSRWGTAVEAYAALSTAIINWSKSPGN